MTDRDSWLWRIHQAVDSAAYINNRRQQYGWIYDAAGNVTSNLTGDTIYDVAGRPSLFKSNRFTVGGGQTGHPVLAGNEIEPRYDPNGQVTRRVQTRRTETYVGSGPETTISTDVTTTYYVRSTVLGGQPIVELNSLGQKITGYVFGGEGKLVRQAVVPGTSNSALAWQHQDPVSAVQRESHGDRSIGFNSDLKLSDPIGAEMELRDPYVFNPSPTYMLLKGLEPLYLEGGDPFDLSGGCVIDGLPRSCSEVSRLLLSGSLEGQLHMGARDIGGRRELNLTGETIYSPGSESGMAIRVNDEIIDSTAGIDSLSLFVRSAGNAQAASFPAKPKLDFLVGDGGFSESKVEGIRNIYNDIMSSENCRYAFAAHGLNLRSIAENGLYIASDSVLRRDLTFSNAAAGLSTAGRNRALEEVSKSHAITIAGSDFPDGVPRIFFGATAFSTYGDNWKQSFRWVMVHELIHATGKGAEKVYSVLWGPLRGDDLTRWAPYAAIMRACN